MIQDLFIPFIAVGLAELGDKTQLSILLLSSKTKKNHFDLLLGIIVAFFLVDGFAILLGSLITDIIPLNFLKLISGFVFLIFGILILKDNEGEGKVRLYSKNSFISGFVLIFITEWGDKTQIVSGLFATEYEPIMVLIGTMTALTLLSAMAIYLGKFISKKFDRKIVTKIAGIVFILIGISLLLF